MRSRYPEQIGKVFHRITSKDFKGFYINTASKLAISLEAFELGIL